MRATMVFGFPIETEEVVYTNMEELKA